MDDIITYIGVIATAVLAGATAVLAGSVWRQTKLQKKELDVLEGQLTQMAIQATYLKSQLEVQIQELQLSHRPYIYVRFIDKPQLILQIVNIGNGHAKDVHLEIQDFDGKPLREPINVYALRSGEGHDTGVILSEGMKFRLRGGYSDFTEGRYKMDKIFEYPPAEIQIF
ncbi:MAG: hypothetical protein ACREBB_06680 [Nitrosotalea sp.]